MPRVGLALRANLACPSADTMQLGQHAVLTLPETHSLPLYRVGLALRANLACLLLQFDATRSARSADPTSRMGLTLPEKTHLLPGFHIGPILWAGDQKRPYRVL
jgi:hypothetical protein